MSGKPKEIVGPPTSAGFNEVALLATPAEIAVTVPPVDTEPQYDFASDEAAECWQKMGRPTLGKPTGKFGFTVADVKAALKEE